MDNIPITYCFKFSDHTQEDVQFELDAQSLELVGAAPQTPPQWTELDYYQCPHCPLNNTLHPNCPLSLRLVPIVKLFDRVFSYDEIHVEVITPERSISLKTTAQRGLSSLMGLTIATSGCPHTIFFKPMARFHLPFASEEETIFRAASMYLLAQYFLNKDGKNPDLNLAGLKKIYDNMQLVNRHITERLRAASKADSSTNAIILLDLFAKAAPYVIEESLDEFRFLFAPYFADNEDIKDT